MKFWDIKHYRQGDDINRKIWVESPKHMNSIHFMRDDGVDFDGDYGCQQALTGDTGVDGGYSMDDDQLPLSWIPDWTGTSFLNASGVAVVGPSYPPVIAECSGDYWPTIAARRYRESGNADAFMSLFAEHVLSSDEYNHFDQVESLLFPFRTAADLCYFNLCRGSFVMRHEANGSRHDRYDDVQIDGDHWENIRRKKEYLRLYSDYVSHGKKWTWERLNGHAGTLPVVALGQIAEHGLLRLLAAKGAAIREHSSGEEWVRPILENDHAWRSAVADETRPLEWWIESHGRWWDVTLDEKRWRVLPVHPLTEVAKLDTAYRRTRRVLPTFFEIE